MLEVKIYYFFLVHVRGMQQQMCRCDAFGCSRMLRFAYTSIYEACEEAYVDGQLGPTGLSNVAAKPLLDK